MCDVRCKKVNGKQMQNLLGGCVKIPGGGLILVGGRMEKPRAEKAQPSQRSRRRKLKVHWVVHLSWNRKRQAYEPCREEGLMANEHYSCSIGQTSVTGPFLGTGWCHQIVCTIFLRLWGWAWCLGYSRCLVNWWVNYFHWYPTWGSTIT